MADHSHADANHHEPIPRLSDLLSPDAIDLLSVKGTNLVDTLGPDAIQDVVFDVLVGRNIRSSTEVLTRRRIALLNLALVTLFINGQMQMANFVEALPSLAAQILTNSPNQTERWLANWAIGLTGKGFQNILRSDNDLLEQYQATYSEISREVIEYFEQQFGSVSGTLTVGDRQIKLSWLLLLYLLNMAGAQTLTIRGSEKSLYGKFFEKLVLGAMLSVLGFDYQPADQIDRAERVFWLSSAGSDERESDATLLYSPGRGVRFDIGFIGSGNTEISLDKVSRYRREAEIGSTHWFMGTIILVDRVGRRSRIVRLAEAIDGHIVQMSAGYWLRTVAKHLQTIVGFEHPLLTLADADIEPFVREQLANVPLTDFIRYTTGSA